MLVCQRDKVNSEQYHVGDKNGPDFSLSEGLISEISYYQHNILLETIILVYFNSVLT